MRYKSYERYKDSGVEWIGEIPEGWEISKVKYICSKYAIYGLNESADNYDNDGVKFIRTTDIDEKGSLNSNISSVFLPEEKTKGYILETGDVLVSRSGSLGISLYFDEKVHGKCCYAGYLVKFRANNSNCSKYLFYFTKSGIFHIQIQMALVSSTISNFNGQKYANMKLLIPYYDEQNAIANFLDQKTAEIDSLIADKKKMVQLLQEMRQAIISEAVTKGLDKNVKMKDSGVEWIGEIPEGWEIIPLKWFISIKSGEFLSKTNMDEDAIIPVIGGNGVMTYTSNSNIKKDTLAIGRVGALCGNVHLIDFVAWITDNALYLNEINNRVYVNYLFYCFEVMNLNRLANRTAQPLITGNVVKNQQIPYPSINVQRSIANFLDQKTTEIDHLIADGEKTIAKLQEYRQSLISEAVTGKIDVRDFIGSTEGGMQDGCNAG